MEGCIQKYLGCRFVRLWHRTQIHLKPEAHYTLLRLYCLSPQKLTFGIFNIIETTQDTKNFIVKIMKYYLEQVLKILSQCQNCYNQASYQKHYNNVAHVCTKFLAFYEIIFIFLYIFFSLL